MKTYKIELTEKEHRFIEKQMDILSGSAMAIEKEMIMDGQFRAGGHKGLSDEENKKIKENFWKSYIETINYLEILKSIRTKFEESYK